MNEVRRITITGCGGHHNPVELSITTDQARAMAERLVSLATAADGNAVNLSVAWDKLTTVPVPVPSPMMEMTDAAE